MNNLEVINQNGKQVVNSRDVAEMVEKNHGDLLRDIKKYVDALGKSNFALADFFIKSTYKDAQGKDRPCFLITRKGCDMVAHKMTGEKGILFTAAYVTKFEEMEKYLATKNKPSYMIADPIERAKKWIEEQEEKKMLEQRVAEYEPKVTYYDMILQSTDTVNISQIAKDYGISGQQLNKVLHEEEIQYKLGGQWLLYAKHQNKGYTKSQTTEYTKSNGEIGTKLHTKWTQKGRLFIHQILSNRGIEPLMDRESEAS